MGQFFSLFRAKLFTGKLDSHKISNIIPPWTLPLSSFYSFPWKKSRHLIANHHDPFLVWLTISCLKSFQRNFKTLKSLFRALITYKETTRISGKASLENTWTFLTISLIGLTPPPRIIITFFYIRYFCKMLTPIVGFNSVIF